MVVRIHRLAHAGHYSCRGGWRGRSGPLPTISRPDGLRMLAASEWQIRPVLPVKHPLAWHSSLLLSECVGHPLILPAPALTIRSLLSEAFARAVPSR